MVCGVFTKSDNEGSPVELYTKSRSIRYWSNYYQRFSNGHGPHTRWDGCFPAMGFTN